jgi:copper chaperone
MKTVKIKGMSCQHCVMAVTKALSAIDGIQNVHVDLAGAQATYDETNPVDAAVIAAAVKKAGYEVVG